ncbi:MAG: hypothetical protein NC548_61985 [Lachnospiraceae bacterium]|nr:hypothetical protein [Lachnospiraceae bacterium]
MKEKYFKFKESFNGIVKDMTDKQAGEFVKGICGYMFNNRPLETKDEYLKGVYLYAKSVLDEQTRNRENGKLGGMVVAEKYKGQRIKREDKANTVSQVVIVSSTEQEIRTAQKPQSKPVADNTRRENLGFRNE